MCSTDGRSPDAALRRRYHARILHFARPSMNSSPSLPSAPRGASTWVKPLLFVLVAAIGLYYVKWSPYYLKSFVAADKHSIGGSILANAPTAPWSAALDYARVYFLAIWKAAVLGVLLGSLVQVLVPRDWLLRVFGQAGLGSTLRGGLFALPGMMCSCCAAPVVAGMRRQQVSVGAALAFWIANPVLNPATLVFMGFVLGWDFAALRLVAGVLLVVGVSLIAQRVAQADALPQAALDAVAAADLPAEDGRPFLLRWGAKLWQLSWTTIPVYIIVVLALGAARVWLFPQVDATMGNSLLWIVALAVVGTLFVIPTAAEIPVVQSMLSLGMGVGPAVALLMTLPSISLPSLLMLRQSFTPRTLMTVTLLTMLIGAASGLAAVILL